MTNDDSRAPIVPPNWLPPGFPTPGDPGRVVMDLDFVTSIHWSDMTRSLYFESHQGGKAYLVFHMEPGRFGAEDPEPKFDQTWRLPDDAQRLWLNPEPSDEQEAQR